MALKQRLISVGKSWNISAIIQCSPAFNWLNKKALSLLSRAASTTLKISNGSHPPAQALHQRLGRPAINWDDITQGIRQHGIRNAAQTTIAPTGTIGTVAGIEGYGCEPVFALAYMRHVDDRGKNSRLPTLAHTFKTRWIKLTFPKKAKRRSSKKYSRTATARISKNFPRISAMFSSFQLISPLTNISTPKPPCNALWITA